MSQSPVFLADRFLIWHRESVVPVLPSQATIRGKAVRKRPYAQTKVSKLLRVLRDDLGLSAREVVNELEQRTGMTVNKGTVQCWGNGSQPPAERWEGVLQPALEAAIRDLKDTRLGGHIPERDMPTEVEGWMKQTGAPTVSELADWLKLPRMTVYRWSKGVNGSPLPRILFIREQVKKGKGKYPPSWKR